MYLMLIEEIDNDRKSKFRMAYAWEFPRTGER